MSDRRRRLLGWVCVWAGAIGALQGLLLSVFPAQVGKERFSYPFDVTGHVLAQVSFFLQHLGLVAGLVALCALPAARLSRPTRYGLWAGTIGMVLLAVQELVAIAAADEPLTSDLATLVSGLYSVPVLLIGVGLSIGGSGLARHTQTTEPAWLRWIPAVLGVWVFVPLSPALMGPFLAGRMAIGSWMVLFVALGWGLSRAQEPAWQPAPRAHAADGLAAAMS
jgi:hypothetical protein